MSRIERLLIANRGEIACRIARTARRLGIPTVGIYSEPDRDAPHVDAVDVAIAIGGVTPADSYLRGDLVIAAATRTGATAIHPGYGFLAENPDFAEQVVAAGLTWVGPTAAQIRLLGDKVAAKRAASEAGVPTTPVIEVADGGGTTGDVPIPALVKAAAGGGGRGMRVVRDRAGLDDAIASAAREALAAFGDGRVFIEPYIEHGRHVEVQVFGDTHGTVVHLGDRECSVQRRNQKVIEEAPSPGIDAAVRARLHEGAVALARHVGYVGAGTVEFMVGDDVEGSPRITFLEVNTRLQVEHPVTEAVTGLDLVELQLLVAEGRPLPITQDDVTCSGHAIEVRLVAEDPATGWLPSSGTLSAFALDDLDGAVRVDAGYRGGSEVSTSYDSLLAKLIAHAPDRASAARRLARAVRGSRVGGVRTNAATLAAVLGDADFLAGRTYTSYLDDHPDVAVEPALAPDDADAHFLAAVFAIEHDHRRGDRVTGFAPSGWRNLRTRGQRRSLVRGAAPDGDAAPAFHAEYVIAPGQPDAAVVLLGAPPGHGADGALLPDERRTVRVRLLRRDGTRHLVEVDGVCHAIDIEISAEASGRRTVLTSSAAGAETWTLLPRFADHDATEIGAGPVSPLPGTVIAVHVEPGDVVADGQLLMVVEAMKMEHKITAHGDAVVAEVRFGVGDRVDAGDLLVALTHHPAGA